MKVIFKDTSEIKVVPDGYARNYLIPKGLAILATDNELRKLEQNRNKLNEEEETEKKDLDLTAKKIDGKLISVSGSVTTKKVSQAIISQVGIRIDKHNIELKDTIKKKGKYNIEINLGKGVKTNIVLEVS